MNYNGMHLLRTAILKKAVEDYLKALKRNDTKKIYELERFFRGEWCELLSGGNGAFIIEKCRGIANRKI